MKPNSISSRAEKTSAGLIVFLLARTVNSLALFRKGESWLDRRAVRAKSEHGESTYALAKWLTKTVALFVSASMAFACICVLGGSTPLARRVMIDLGSVKSYISRTSLVSLLLPTPSNMALE